MFNKHRAASLSFYPRKAAPILTLLPTIPSYLKQLLIEDHQIRGSLKVHEDEYMQCA